MTTIEKIRAEIERRFREYNKDSNHHLQAAEDAELLSFLSTLESEKPMQDGLEEELDKWRHEHFHGKRDDHFSGEYLERTSQLDLARHFAQWGAEHLANSNDEVVINGHKVEYDKDKDAITMEEMPKDLEEAAKKHAHCPFTDDEGNFHEDAFDVNAYHDFIAGAKWQKHHDSELIEIAYNDGITIGMTKQKEQMMKDYPKWRRIKAGERLPCPAYVWTIAYDNYPDCFEGRLMPNIQGVKVGRDTWYLTVDVIHNLPKED